MIFRYLLLVFLTTFISIEIYGQGKNLWHHEIGINLLQIPATSLDFRYNFASKPRYSLTLNSGYTFNYAKSYDFVGFLLSPHYKCGNNGYSIKKQSGGFLKLGLRYNHRKFIDDNNYFFLGLFITNSLVTEKAEYNNWEIPDSKTEYLHHTIFIGGLTCEIGYNFRINNKLNSDFGAQVSFPSKKHTNLYGYTNFIPGMGYMETCGGERIFPMIFLNMKYLLKK